MLSVPFPKITYILLPTKMLFHYLVRCNKIKWLQLKKVGSYCYFPSVNLLNIFRLFMIILTYSINSSKNFQLPECVLLVTDITKNSPRYGWDSLVILKISNFSLYDPFCTPMSHELSFKSVIGNIYGWNVRVFTRENDYNGICDTGVWYSLLSRIRVTFGQCSCRPYTTF